MDAIDVMAVTAMFIITFFSISIQIERTETKLLKKLDQQQLVLDRLTKVLEQTAEEIEKGEGNE